MSRRRYRFEDLEWIYNKIHRTHLAITLDDIELEVRRWNRTTWKVFVAGAELPDTFTSVEEGQRAAWDEYIHKAGRH